MPSANQDTRRGGGAHEGEAVLEGHRAGKGEGGILPKRQPGGDVGGLDHLGPVLLQLLERRH